MPILRSGLQNQQTRDQLGSEPSIAEVYKVKTDNVKLVESPIQISKTPEGHGWIVGSSTNAIVGTWTGTQDGSQLVVGSGTSAGQIAVVDKVLAPNNTAIELFNYATFNDVSTTTSTWASGSADFGAASIAQSLSVYTDVTSVANATMTVTASPSTSTLSLAMSATSPASFESVTDSTKHTFASSGNDLRWKITNNSGAVSVTRVQVSFNE